MRRTLEFLKWKAASWSAKAPPSGPEKPPLPPLVLEGLTAYAFRQAEVYLSLHDHFLSLWHGFTVLDNSADPLPPVPLETETEEAMQGIDGGDM